MRRQFVLDDQSEKLLDHLAAARAGNRSFVVREAIALYASLEERLGEIEAQPGFQRMMRRTAADISAGHVVTHSQVKKLARQSSRPTSRQPSRQSARKPR